ncbi:hypothetical protein B0H13DRAFT_1984835 [Mycena leptocephala]|nr:hypothetical protein B0H13DRAFT_1984835 [Mycena leptocephala]
MFDHYYTPREDHLLNPMSALPLGDDNPLGPMHGLTEVDMAKPRPAALHTVVDLSTLALAFDCDSGSESGSDDGYVSTLLRIQRAAPLPATPRKIAGARRVARAASAPQAQLVRAMMEIDVDSVEGQIGAGMRVGASGTTKATEARSAPEGELFQSITATPGLESTSFEELRLETYLQSLVATGTARPQPAFARALVIPPGFAAQFVEVESDPDGDDVADAEMVDVEDVSSSSTATATVTEHVKTGDPRVQKTTDPRTRDPRLAQQAAQKTQDPRVQQAQPHPPFVFRAASFPPSGQTWG